MEVDGKNDEKSKKSSLNLQVRFTTKQEQYAIPDYPFSVDANLGSNELNQLVNRVLVDDGTLEKSKQFDFLIGGEFLRGSLEELVLRHEALKSVNEGEVKKSLIGVEEIFEVEYIESCPAPEPKDTLMHDDWVSAVDVNQKWILSGCYDNSLHLWSVKGKHKEAFVGHLGPIKAVAWISVDDNLAVFASGSQDQTMNIWEWDFDSNQIKCKWSCKGHERSIESLKGDPNGTMIGTGSWDGHLKIWSASTHISKTDKKSLQPELPDADPNENKIKTRTPLLTLGGHRECISGLDWIDSSELISCSWDHTIKLWDVEMGGLKSEIPAQKAFFCVSYSQINKTIVAGSADRLLRIYDPRSNEGSVVKITLSSHSGWINGVYWSGKDENLLISGSQDKIIKLWDRRSPSAPLFNLTGHTENILCVNWSNDKYIVSGGSDNSLRIFKSNN